MFKWPSISWWVRNGMVMMTDDPNAIAAESFAFWTPLVKSQIHTFALLGDEDGETSFRPHVIGDHGEAFGPFQWHQARVDGMIKGCGIDVRKASHLDQLKAAHWEMTEGSYRRVWPALMATAKLEDAITVLVHIYEGSAQQARDVTRRTALAQNWMTVFGEKS